MLVREMYTEIKQKLKSVKDLKENVANGFDVLITMICNNR